MSNDNINPYELLHVTTESTEAEIRKAYRQSSLKVHPDRNPDNPDAARLFHELTVGYEILLDPAKRALLDARIRLAEAKKARTSKYDQKRKNMLADLEEREADFKKARVEKARAEAARFSEDERVKEEGRRMREEREKMAREAQLRAAEAAKPPTPKPEEEAPALGPLDTTVRLKYTLASQPSLTTSAAVCALLAPFGALDAESAVLSLKPPAKPKRAVVLVPFDKVVAAFAAVGASGRKEWGLEGVEITWAGGTEPELIGWLRKTGKLGSASSASKPTTTTPATAKQGPSTGTARSDESQKTGSASSFSFVSGSTDGFSSFPSTFPTLDSHSSGSSTPIGGIDLESLTLLRMRQAERERLEREILEQEAAEG